jgi:hypothetical protein
METLEVLSENQWRFPHFIFENPDFLLFFCHTIIFSAIAVLFSVFGVTVSAIPLCRFVIPLFFLL